MWNILKRRTNRGTNIKKFPHKKDQRKMLHDAVKRADEDMTKIVITVLNSGDTQSKQHPSKISMLKETLPDLISGFLLQYRIAIILKITRKRRAVSTRMNNTPTHL